MKQLALIRHANATHNGHGIRDFDRPLSYRGERDAPRMATHLQQQAFLPDLMLSSPATRAATTAETIARGIGYDTTRILWMDQLYAATRDELLAIIAAIDPKHECVAIVGHNPSLTDLVNHLQGEFVTNIPSGGVVTISLAIEHWSDIAEGTGTRVRLDAPGNLK